MESTLKRVLIGLGIGAAFALVFALLLSGPLGLLSFWPAFVWLLLACGGAGALVGFLMWPRGLLSTLVSRVPDRYVFPALLAFLFTSMIFWCFGGHDLAGAARALPIGGDGGNPRGDPTLLFWAVVGFEVFIGLGFIVSVRNAGRRVIAHGVELDDSDFGPLFDAARDQYSPVLGPLEKNGQTVERLAGLYGFSEGFVQACVQHWRRKNP